MEQIHKELDCWNCNGTGEQCDCSCHKAYKKAKHSTVVTDTCKACGKVAVEVSRERDNEYVTIHLACGHVILREVDSQELKEEVYTKFTSLKGETLFPFQVEGVKFLEECDGRGIITDDVGLGKSVQTCTYLNLHEEKWPVVIVTKSALIEQWYRYTVNWLKALPQVLETGTDFPILKGMTDVAEYEVFIVSYDAAARQKWMFKREISDKIKTVVLDECQMIKSLDAKRTKAIRAIAEGKNVIGLSNTPIKNNASEYFNILNLVRPEKFYAFTPFTKEWVERYESDSGAVKFGGIKEYKVQEWNAYTKGFILRRTKREVMPDLPEVVKNIKFYPLGKETRDAYNKIYEEFEKDYDNWDGVTAVKSTNLLGYMSKMRHIVGMAKVKPMLENIEQFLEERDEQTVIGVHHKLVAELLLKHVAVICEKMEIPGPLSYHSGLNGEERDNLIAYFRGDWNAATENIDPKGNELKKKDQKHRVMIASVPAIKEGVNAQFIQYVTLGEQEWTPSDEDQFFGRFSRINTTFVGNVFVDVPIATDTIDELLVEIKARKAAAMSSTLDGKYKMHTEDSILKELANELRKKGRAKRWSPSGI